MADLRNCPTCGRQYNASVLKECPACRSRGANQRRTAESFAAEVAERVDQVGSVTLFHEVYLNVDAQMNAVESPAGLDLFALNDLGLQGWTVVSTIPRTYGGFQSYKVSKTTAYGIGSVMKDQHQVGLGGHVIGVYVLLSYTVTQSNLAASTEAIQMVARNMAT